MKDIFTPKLHPKVRPNDVLVKHHNTITYVTKSLKALGPRMWNQLPSDIKWETSYTKFKECTDTWIRPKCRCVPKYLKLHECKMCANTCRRSIICFNVFTDILAQIWYISYYGFYYFSFLILSYYFPRIDKDYIHTKASNSNCYRLM